MTTWEPELCDKLPRQFQKVSEDKYIQRKDIHHVVYHAMDGSESYSGYECYRRELNYFEYLNVLANTTRLILD